MLKWFKRRPSAPTPAEDPPAKPAARAPRPAAAPLQQPVFALSAPLPEVLAEGNTQADWSAWEDSVSSLDSQLQGLVPTARIYVRDTRPTQLEDIDAFAAVRGKRRS